MPLRAAHEPLLTVVIAAHNEEDCVREVVTRVASVILQQRCRLEFVLVDDGSVDRTWQIITEVAADDSRVQAIRIPRNVGHQPALMRGIVAARGDVVITMDADLQHPPACLVPMLDAWRAGFDVVHMRRRDDDPLTIRNALGAMFYVLYNAVSDVDLSPSATDFRLIDRACIDPLRTEWDRRHFLRAAARRIGFAQTELEFDAPPRFAGRSSYTLPKLLVVASKAVIAAALHGSRSSTPAAPASRSMR